MVAPQLLTVAKRFSFLSLIVACSSSILLIRCPCVSNLVMMSRVAPSCLCMRSRTVSNIVAVFFLSSHWLYRTWLSSKMTRSPPPSSVAEEAEVVLGAVGAVVEGCRGGGRGELCGCGGGVASGGCCCCAGVDVVVLPEVVMLAVGAMAAAAAIARAEPSCRGFVAAAVAASVAVVRPAAGETWPHSSVDAITLPPLPLLWRCCDDDVVGLASLYGDCRLSPEVRFCACGVVGAMCTSRCVCVCVLVV